MSFTDEKRRPDYDEEKTNGVTVTHDRGSTTYDHGLDAPVDDVFIEKEEHQIHYKTLSWQVSRLKFRVSGSVSRLLY